LSACSRAISAAVRSSGAAVPAEYPSPLGAQHPAGRQPLVEHAPQLLAERPDHGGRLAALPLDQGLQGGVENLVPGRRGIADDDAPAPALVLVAGDIHLAQQGQLGQVRAAQPGVDRLAGHRQPSGGIVGDQEEQVLGEEHAAYATWPGTRAETAIRWRAHVLVADMSPPTPDRFLAGLAVLTLLP